MSLKSEIGGKTGTTNDFVDGWFMGITPGLVVGTWVGGEDRWVRFRTITYGQGARMAKPYCQDFIKRLENDENADYDYKKRFKRPPGDLGIVIDCGEYEDEMKEDDPNEDPFGDETLLEEDPFGEEDE
jgi:penicillin-binding protein 1A